MRDKESIREMATAFQKSRVLLTAYELGLFTVLDKDSKTSAYVAKIIGANKRSTDRLMNTLCAIGLLKKKKEKFSNTPAALRFLVRKSPEFVAFLAHTVNSWYTWSTLTEAVRKGKSVADTQIHKRGQKWLEAFIGAMHERASEQAKTLLTLIDLHGVKEILDVGGGSGAYSMAFVRAQKEIKATVFDLPNVLPITRRYIREKGLSERVKTVAGNYTSDNFSSSFDLVFLSHIIHSNSFKENQNLIQKCSSALNPNGQIVIQDFIMEEDRTRPVFGAFFSLNMLVGTASGDTYTEKELRLWLKKSGIVDIARKDTKFGTTLIIGRKRK